MPWEFEGPDKNPLQFEDYHKKPRDDFDKQSIDLDPKLHRIVLSPLETMLAAAVLSEAIQKVNIFLAHLPPTDAKFEFRDITTRVEEPVIRSVDMAEKDISYERKLSSDLMVMKTLMFMVKDELLIGEEPAALYFYNDLTLFARQKENEISKIHPHISDKMTSIKKDMTEANRMLKSSLIGMESGIATVDAGFEEACSVATIMKEFATKFHKARIEQNTLKITIAEKGHKKELYDKLKAIEDEHRANKLITKYVVLATENSEKMIAHWSKKYDQDVEEIDLKIATANQEIPDLIFSLAKVLTEYYKREMEMAQYIRRRNWRLKVEDIGRFLEFFAILIQAWWRGSMVRWEIGPYRLRKVRRK